jgi:putative nucleotidyltransferase with HDIG domain
MRKELNRALAESERMLEGMIHTLSSTVEARDPYTSGHQTRVAQLACAIARELALPEDRIAAIRMAGVIHDIGKIAVPAEILSKPSRLLEVEFQLLKIHPRVGYDILKNSSFPLPLADIVYQHHERIDGSGYPRGLTGRKILLEARIMTVADVVEAMSSHRPYRPAIGIDATLRNIGENRGTLFDPDVVDACLKVIREKGFAFDG